MIAQLADRNIFFAGARRGHSGPKQPTTERAVHRALARTGGNESQTARIPGIGRKGLRKMLKRLQISA